MRRTLFLATLLLLLAACNHEKRGSAFKLPERSTHVLDVEQRVAPLIERTQRGSTGPGECAVRLLGEKDDTTWVWASCRWLPSSGVGGPFRIDGDKVTATGEGSEYEASVRQLFPYDMAEAILHDAERLQPEDSPTG